MKKFLLISLAIFSTFVSFAQVSLGVGDFETNMPVNAYYGYTYSQTIYLADDINASGSIDSIGYYLTPGTNLSSSNDWLVFIGHTSLSEFSGSWIDVIMLDTVFSGIINIQDTSVFIPFDESFDYNGTDNIVICVLQNQDGYNGSYDKFYGTSTSTSVSRLAYTDFNPYDPYTPPGFANDEYNYPDITFYGIVQSCLTPTNLTLDSITDVTANISWSGVGSDFQVDIAEEGVAVGSGTIFSSNFDSLYIDTLSGNTEYRVSVREICGAGDTSSWTTQNFTTLCSAFETPEYNEDFAIFLNTCWERKKGLISDSTTFEANTSTWWSDGFGNVGSSGSARVNLYNNQKDWLISTSINLGDGSIDYQLSFDAALTSFFGTDATDFGVDDSVFVIISTDNGSTWSDDNKLIEWYKGTILSNEGENIIIDLSGYTGVVKFGFYAFSPIQNEDINFYIDNFKVFEKPNCPPPMQLTVSNILSTSALLSWSSVDTSFAVAYGLSGFDQDTAGQIITPLYNDSVQLSDLEANSSYDYYVRTYCSNNDTSVWIGPFTFTTLCSSIIAPTDVEPFDNNLPECWTDKKGLLSDTTVFTQSGSDWVSDGFGNIGSSGSMRINIYNIKRDWLISPSIDLGNVGNNLQLEFNLITTSYSGTSPAVFGSDDTFELIISTDNGLTWSAVNVMDAWSLSNPISNVSELKVYDLSSYSGVVRFAFYAESTVANNDINVYVDNFKINTCTQYFNLIENTCEFYISPSGQEITTSGLINDTIFSAVCDSIFNIDLNISLVTSSFMEIVECDTFVSVAGNIYTQTGIYSDTIVNTNLCDSIVETTLSVLYLELAINQSQNIFLESFETDPAATYQWVNCSDLSPISGQTSAEFTAPAIGDYACEISMGNCVEMSECISVTSLDTVTSITQYKTSDIDIYPNPSNGNFTLKLKDKPQVGLSLSIINVLGQEVYEQKVVTANNKITLSHLEKGMYILELKSDNQSIKKRILID